MANISKEEKAKRKAMGKEELAKYLVEWKKKHKGKRKKNKGGSALENAIASIVRKVVKEEIAGLKLSL